MSFCTKCGNQIPENAKFCTRCGQKVVVFTPTRPQTPVISAPETAAPAPQPVCEAPVYEAPAAPVYEAPSAPIYETPSAPIYETPAAPVSQPVYAEPAAPAAPFPAYEAPQNTYTEPAPKAAPFPAYEAPQNTYAEPAPKAAPFPAYEAPQNTYAEPAPKAAPFPAYEAPQNTYAEPAPKAAPFPAYEAPAAPKQPEPPVYQPPQPPVYQPPMYQPPVRNDFAPSQSSYDVPWQNPPTEKKSGGKIGAIIACIVGGLAVVAAVIIGLILLLGGLKGNNDPNLGLYEAISCDAYGMELGVDDEWIELKSGGKAVLKLMGEEYNCKWSLDGDNLTIKQAGDEFEGTLSDGLLTIDFKGMVYTYEKEGREPSSVMNPLLSEDEVRAIREYWEGEWYGWWIVWLGEGEYAELEDSGWDAYARIEVYDDGTGNLILWDSDGSADDPLAECELSFGPGLLDSGTLVSETGYFIDNELTYADWLVEPGSSNVSMFDHMIAINGYYVDPNNSENTCDYYIILRPWGMDWEDVDGADTSESLYDDMMPFEYDNWYLPLLEMGVTTMPDSYEEGLEILGE